MSEQETGTESTERHDADRGFAPFARKMRLAGLAPVVIETFRYHYGQLVAGDTGLIAESGIRDVGGLADADFFEGHEPAGRAALARTVVIKLNGGLGTSMGLERAKSLLPVRDGLSFLDVIVRQALHLRQASGQPVPLVFMNSFNTQADTLAALEAYPDLAGSMPLTFLQHRVPKVLQDGLTPATADDPELEWCPPGHGDIYTAMVTSGLLTRLLEDGYEYAFVSNADNLGAVLDLGILGYQASRGIPFLMEVADRTPADSKGGHLARHPDGRLLLREVAQCPPEEMEAFADIGRHRYFNTNNLWLHLPSLQAVLDAHEGVIELPLIRNGKRLDPRDADSPMVYQLETAMGAAIEVFRGSEAVRVSRRRFAPVKLCSDLLVLWSDVYQVTPSWQVLPSDGPERALPVVRLDPQWYGLIDQMRERFPHGAPSLRDCQELEVRGDVHFGRRAVARGTVRMVHDGPEPLVLGDDVHLVGEPDC